eukprot:217319-Pleurochrysis_carterae.AAC.1
MHRRDRASLTRVVGKRHFAGARGGVAVGARVGQLEVLERGAGELRVAHAAVARHAAAGDGCRVHLVRAHLGELHHL